MLLLSVMLTGNYKNKYFYLFSVFQFTWGLGWFGVFRVLRRGACRLEIDTVGKVVYTLGLKDFGHIAGVWVSRV